MPAGRTGEPSGQMKPHGSKSRSRALTFIAVLALASVLRPSVVVIGPVLPSLQADLHLGAGAAALLTTLPVLFFGIGAFAGPGLANRIGVDRGLTSAVVLLIIGSFVRLFDGPILLFIGTALIGAGIAIGNVLLPALVRRDFPDRIGTVTGLYTSTLALSSAVAAATAVPLAGSTAAGWRVPLALWGFLAVLALLVWAPHQWVHRHQLATHTNTPRILHLVRHSTVRSLTAYMGLQSIGFYAMVTWLPSLLQDSGTSASTAGALLSVGTVLGIPAALAVPPIAARMPQQHWIAVGTTALTAAGWAGLLVAPSTMTLVWVVLLGLGTGATFPTALLLISLRSSDPSITPGLSATVQGFGYLLAATGPFLVGILHQGAGNWTVPLIFLLILDALQVWAAWSAGRSAPI